MSVARFVALAMKVAITNIFTIIKCSLSTFNNSLNNKYLVDSYYLILFVAFAFTISLGICEEQA
jgi:membrane protease YdiL (CAAX protease family)